MNPFHLKSERRQRPCIIIYYQLRRINAIWLSKKIKENLTFCSHKKSSGGLLSFTRDLSSGRLFFLRTPESCEI